MIISPNVYLRSISSFKNNLYSPYFFKLESTFVWRQSNAHLEDLLAIPKLMRGLGTSVKKCPNQEMNQVTKKTTSKLVSMQSLKTFTWIPYESLLE
jgi:p-aminobenzoyl-glutamate transporter AbgT